MQANTPLRFAAIAAVLGAIYVALVSVNSGGYATHGPAETAKHAAEPVVAASSATPLAAPSSGASGHEGKPMVHAQADTPVAQPATPSAAAPLPGPTVNAPDGPATQGGSTGEAPAASPAAPGSSAAAPTEGASPAAPAGPAAPAIPAAPANPSSAQADPAAPGNPTAAAPASPADSTAAAADAATVARLSNPWPCVQAKVHTIDEVAVWDGPSVAEIKDWFNDGQINDLVSKLISRRTPLPDAEKAVEAFAQSVPETERDAKLSRLFAGLLSTANNQRNSIIGGIERFQKRQVQNAKEIERQGEEIAKLEETAPSDLTLPTPELDQAREKYDWFARVFQERQGNIPIACELPTMIEQRVFALARSIRAQMKS